MNELGWFQPPWRARNEGEGVPEGSMPFAKGPSQKNRDVSWRVSAASLVNGAPFYYTREHHPSTILISPSLSPRAAYGSPLFLSLFPAGQTSPSIIDLVENIYYEKTSARQAKMLETFFIRFESFPFADEGLLWEIWIQTMFRSIWRHIIFLLFFHVYYSYFLYSIVFYHKMYQLTKFIYYPIIGE